MGSQTLGIWIPTWNRPGFFNRLIDSIEPQLHPDLTIACGINGTTDEYRIPEWVQQTINPSNIGQSLNILLGINQLETDYIWILGDDEQVKTGGIAEVIERIQGQPGMVICTDGRFDHGPEGDYPTWIDWADACVNTGRGVMLTAQTLISSTVFWRPGMDMSTAYSYLNSKYGHHFGFLAGLMRDRVTVTRRPVFTAGHNTDSHIHYEDFEVRSTHGPICQASLRHLIAWINEKAERSYDVNACYTPGVGFDS